MAGRKPDADVLVAVSYDGKEGAAMAYHNVGAAWLNDNGNTWFTLVTNPGVRFMIKKREVKENGKPEAKDNGGQAA